MSARTTTTRRVLAALGAPLVMAGLVLAPASTAQAHDNTWVDEHTRDTDKCPCFLSDSYDGTYFKHDADGLAYKGEIYSGQELVGKVEFHPYGEKLWTYDTKANGDGLYFAISWWENGKTHTSYVETPSGASSSDLDLPEGKIVTIQVWDDGFWSEDSELLNATAVT